MRMLRLLIISILVLTSACSEYLPISGGKLEGNVSNFFTEWTPLSKTKIVQMETKGSGGPYSVNLWTVDVNGLPYIFAGDNLAKWVKNIAKEPNVRLKVQSMIFELKAVRIKDKFMFEVFAKAWAKKYGNRPRNENIKETYLFKLEPRNN